jgi:hypothetical protein
VHGIPKREGHDSDPVPEAISRLISAIFANDGKSVYKSIRSRRIFCVLLYWEFDDWAISNGGPFRLPATGEFAKV